MENIIINKSTQQNTSSKPICFGNLSDTEFNSLMDSSYNEYLNGQCSSLESFIEEIKFEIRI